MAKAGPILLEPVSELVVTVPEANQGDIMGDLNSQARAASRARRRSATARSRSSRIGADVGDPALRDRPALDDRRPRPLHDDALALRPGARATSSTRSSRSTKESRERSHSDGVDAHYRRSRASVCTDAERLASMAFSPAGFARLGRRRRESCRRPAMRALRAGDQVEVWVTESDGCGATLIS